MNEDLGLPFLTADAAPYWDAAARGSLEIQRCESCGVYQFPPSFLCRACHSDQIGWAAVSGKGTVHSFTIVHRAPSQAWRGRVPYVIAFIDLAEGPRLMANVVGPDRLDVAIGDPVEVEFEARGAISVPQFRRGQADA